MSKAKFSISLLLASGLGSGYFPFASGTFGSLAAIAFWRLFILPFCNSTAELVLSTLAVCVVGVISSNIVLEERVKDNSQQTSKKFLDPSFIVIDEWAGMWISLLAVQSSNILSMTLAFLLFRLFDVSKLGPIAWAEKLRLGWGVMADDILAGICSYLVLKTLIQLLPNYLV